MNKKHLSCGPECYEASPSEVKYFEKISRENRKTKAYTQMHQAVQEKTARLADITAYNIELNSATTNIERLNAKFNIMQAAQAYIEACERIYHAEEELINIRLEEAGIE